MIALDTNILVRYFAQDDPTQCAAVLRFLSKPSGVYYISDFVALETAWVLQKAYHWSPAEVAQALTGLLLIHNLVFRDEYSLKEALRAYENGADLGDELIWREAQAAGCKKMASFDRKLQKSQPGFVVHPS
jgi:predicted nucleic-acid-binding protein